MKRWSTSYVNWQSQVKIKTIVVKNGTADLEQLHSEFQASQGYAQTLSQQNNIKQNKKKIAKFQNTDHTKCWQGREDQEVSFITGLQNGTTTLEAYVAVSYKANTRTIMYLSYKLNVYTKTCKNIQENKSKQNTFKIQQSRLGLEMHPFNPSFKGQRQAATWSKYGVPKQIC